jgi:hypothetical protein
VKVSTTAVRSAKDGAYEKTLIEGDEAETLVARDAGTQGLTRISVAQDNAWRREPQCG